MFSEIRLPINYDYGSKTGPGTNSLIYSSDAGFEGRAQRWVQSRGQYQIDYTIKSAVAAAVLKGFYMCRRGEADGFRFRDLYDFSSAPDGVSAPSPTDQALVTDDDGNIRLAKLYGLRYRYIFKPILGTIVVASAGTPITGWIIDPSTGILSGVVGDGPFTAGFYYDVPVRFDGPLQIEATDAGTFGVVALKLQELIYKTNVIPDFSGDVPDPPETPTGPQPPPPSDPTFDNAARDLSPANTGAGDSSGFTHVGSLKLKNGDVIQNLYVNGSLKAVLAAGQVAHIHNLIIDGGYTGGTTGATYGINLFGNLGTVYIDHVEIRNVKSAGVYGGNFQLTNSYIHHSGGDGIKPTIQVLLQGNLVKFLGYNQPSAHADGVQIRAGSSITITGNSFPISAALNVDGSNTFKNNSGVFIQGDGGGGFSSNITITSNYINTDNTGIHGWTDSGDGSSIHETTNIIDAAGTPFNNETGVVLSGNVDGTGSPIP